MSKFADIQKRADAFSPDCLGAVFVAKFDAISHMKSYFNNVDIVAMGFVNNTIAADGIVDDTELKSIAEFAKSTNPEAAEKIMKIAESSVNDLISGEFKIDKLKYMFKGYPEFIRDEIVLICILMAKADGSFDEKEKAWLDSIAF